jgi:hypothetical protein
MMNDMMMIDKPHGGILATKGIFYFFKVNIQSAPTTEHCYTRHAK